MHSHQKHTSRFNMIVSAYIASIQKSDTGRFYVWGQSVLHSKWVFKEKKQERRWRRGEGRGERGICDPTFLVIDPSHPDKKVVAFHLLCLRWTWTAFVCLLTMDAFFQELLPPAACPYSNWILLVNFVSIHFALGVLSYRSSLAEFFRSFIVYNLILISDTSTSSLSICIPLISLLLIEVLLLKLRFQVLYWIDRE